MEVIPPDNKNVLAMEVLQGINEALKLPRVKRSFVDLDKRDDSSVRMIQGQRFEIFVEAKDKGSEAFQKILSSLSSLRTRNSKKILLNYAEQQAKQDPRIQNGRFKFGNFSLLVSYGEVEAQAPHLDLIRPNHQFGLVITDNTPGTLVYETGGLQISNVNDLKEAWSEFPSAGEMPGTLETSLYESRNVKNLLKDYGDVLVPNKRENVISERLKVGTLLSLPGSVLHGGPKSKDFRAILFFSGWPVEERTVSEYNPDTQYSDVFLCSEIVSKMWRTAHADTVQRTYLLRILVWYIKNAIKHGSKNVSGNIREDNMHKFVHTVEARVSKSSSVDLEKFIALTAKRVEFCALCLEEFENISVTNLVTTWEGSPSKYRVSIYQRPKDGKIILYYPTDDMWEGCRARDNFKLTWHNDINGQRFDGTNGVLTDTSGEVIPFEELHESNENFEMQKRRQLPLEDRPNQARRHKQQA